MWIESEYLGEFFQEPNKQATTKTPVLSSVVQVRAKDEALGVKNNLAEPEYDFLSKQPTEVIDETYRVSKTWYQRNNSNTTKVNKVNAISLSLRSRNMFHGA